MPSKREQVLSTLLAKMKALETSSIKVYRNLDMPPQVPDTGMIILRDGTEEEPEVLLSPLTYIYEHLVTAEVIVQESDAALRDSQIDSLLVSIGSVINANRTLNGLAEWVEARSPDFQQEPIEGAATIRTASVLIMIRYFTTDPLN
ncbi:MAG: hypothetical protein ACOYNL_10785 [Rickettsiales bacterium]